MKWVAISGSWSKTNKKVEMDVRSTVKDIFYRGDGIVSGGAPGVDYIATDEALKINPNAERIRIYLPTSLDFYIQHTKRRTKEGIIKKKASKTLIKQLYDIYRIDPLSIIDGEDIPGNKYVEKWQYYKRNGLIVDAADELIAFHVNQSYGTSDAINKAREKGIPVKVFSYTIK